MAVSQYGVGLLWRQHESDLPAFHTQAAAWDIIFEDFGGKVTSFMIDDIPMPPRVRAGTPRRGLVPNTTLVGGRAPVRISSPPWRGCQQGRGLVTS